MLFFLLTACRTTIAVTEVRPPEPQVEAPEPSPVPTPIPEPPPEPGPPRDHVFRIQRYLWDGVFHVQDDYYFVLKEHEAYYPGPWLPMHVLDPPMRILSGRHWVDRRFQGGIHLTEPAWEYQGRPQADGTWKLQKLGSVDTEWIVDVASQQVLRERWSREDTVTTLDDQGRVATRRSLLRQPWGTATLWFETVDAFVWEDGNDTHTTRTTTFRDTTLDPPDPVEVESHVFDDQGRWIERYNTTGDEPSHLQVERWFDSVENTEFRLWDDGELSVRHFDDLGRIYRYELFERDLNPDDGIPPRLSGSSEFAWDEAGRVVRDDYRGLELATYDSEGHLATVEDRDLDEPLLLSEPLLDFRGRVTYAEAVDLETGWIRFWYQMEDLGPLETFDLSTLPDPNVIDDADLLDIARDSPWP